MQLLSKYKNGNLITSLYSDGTRIRYTKDNKFKPQFAENVDVHISNKCDRNCGMCYARCTPNGEFGELFNWNFLNSLHPGTEMALNLNFPIHPKFYEFLSLLKEKGIITNVTVNQIHFELYEPQIQKLIKNGLIHGLGISLVAPTVTFIQTVKKYDNAVIHVINGLINKNDIESMKSKGLKILILGYKNTGRGTEYFSNNKNKIEKNKKYLYDSLNNLISEFKVISFDNLALKQLNVKRLLNDEQWEEFYSGDDGTFTFFINLVDGYFAKNSLSPIHYPIKNKTMDEMFEIIVKDNQEKIA